MVEPTIPYNSNNRLSEGINGRSCELIERIKMTTEDIKITKNTKVIFLLGAGASAPSGIPTTYNLLNELYKAAKRNNQKDLLDLLEYCNKMGIDNIEDILTATYILNFIENKENLVYLLMYLLEIEIKREKITIKREDGVGRSLSQILFSLLASIMLTAEPNDAHKAIADFIRSYPETEKVSIITTNYDCLMEEALLNEEISAEIIKMHGSINWWYCEICHNTYEQNPKKLRNAFSDGVPYPVFGVCPNCSGITKPLLILPYSFKFVPTPKIIDVWYKGKKRIEDADIAIVVGYAFPEGDEYLMQTLLQMLKKPNSIVIIINKDPNAAEELKDKLIYIFDDKNVVEKKVRLIEGDCKFIVPLLIRELLKKIKRRYNK